MRILYITTVGETMYFFRTFIRRLIDEGNVVDIATNENNGNSSVMPCYREWGCNVFHISCNRSPIDKGNLLAIKEIKKLVQDNKYDLVHCHTPIAAACTRIACRSLRSQLGVRVVYTAHGFHFYFGAPLKNWLIFYPIEWICSWFTDVLITINKEDYERARNHFHAKRIEYVPGVGVDVSKFGMAQDKMIIRNEFGIAEDKFLLLSVGRLDENKNHESVIRAISGIKNLVYVIVGAGPLSDNLKKVANDNNVDVILTGARNDVDAFYASADCYILPSIREGLNVSLMEAMASGLPCLCSKIRGNEDLIDQEGGLYFDPRNIESIRESINELISNINFSMGEHNKQKVKMFGSVVVENKLDSIYCQV